MARDIVVLILVICVAAAIPELVIGAVDAIKRRMRRGNTKR